MVGIFDGFPDTTIPFLRQLSANNNREWFNANKDRYLDEVVAPSLRFIEAMGPKLKRASPHFTAIAKRTGGSLMRIYRDTRFSKDKTPYKTNIGIQFRHEFGKDVHAPGYYFHISPDDVFFGAGIWRPESSLLNKIRSYIDEEPVAWKRLTRSKQLQDFRWAGQSLKRPPRGYPNDHPLIDDLKRKDFIGTFALNQQDVTSAELVDRLVMRIKQTKKFMQFLCDAIPLPC